MAALRCPQCHLPVTDLEAHHGACPVCSAPLTPMTAAPKPTSPPPAPQSSPLGTWLFFCGLAVFLLVLSFFLMLNMFEKPEPKEEPKLALSHHPSVDKKLLPLKKLEEKKELKPENNQSETKKSEWMNPNNEGKAREDTKNQAPKKEDSKMQDPIKLDPKAAQEKPPLEKLFPQLAEVKMIPAAPGPRFAVLPLLDNETIKIDGDLGDWKDVTPVLLHPVDLGSAPKKALLIPKAQAGYIAYCRKGLLIAVDILDPSGELENVGKPAKGGWPFWFNDGLEIYVDTLNKRSGQRGEENAHQFFAFPFGSPGDQGIGGYESRILGRRQEWTIVPHTNSGPEAMLRAGKKTPIGWTMEFLIPRAALRHGDFKAGTVFGFEIQVDTGTNIYYFWANQQLRGRVSTHPHLWGEILLAGTDGRLELLDAAKKTVKTFTPGKELTLRVNDGDANFDPEKKEKLVVTARSRSGDLKVVTLEETAANSGVFVGSIATRTSTGQRAENVFEVLEGETILVDYLDQVRANGDRNVTVQEGFKVQGSP